MDPDFPHLNLRRWPFDIVPSGDGVTRWVGRPAAGKRLNRLVSSAVRVPTSRVVLLWATFGSGKTHALRHLEWQADTNGEVVSIYVVVPRGIRSFLDIHRAVIDSLNDKAILTKLGHDVLSAKGPGVDSDVERALIRLAVGSEEERRIATAWLRADRVPVRDLRVVGLSHRVETAADAVRILDDVIKASHKSAANFMLLLDEVQELEELGRRLPECVGGLHKLFDLNPRGLTLILSFTTGSRSTVESIIGEALYSRAGEFLALPGLDPAEATEFVKDLLTVWAVDAASVPFPFSPGSIEAVVDELGAIDGSVTPRSLMKAFDQVLRDAEAHLAEGEIVDISPEFALESLSSVTGA